MRIAEVIRKLKEMGFTLVRRGKKHEIWRKDDIVVPIGTTVNPRTPADLRRLERLFQRRAKA